MLPGLSAPVHEAGAESVSEQAHDEGERCPAGVGGGGLVDVGEMGGNGDFAPAADLIPWTPRPWPSMTCRPTRGIGMSDRGSRRRRTRRRFRNPHAGDLHHRSGLHLRAIVRGDVLHQQVGGSVAARVLDLGPHQTHCDLDLMVSDLRIAQVFYGAVLGWQFQASSMGERFMVASVDGSPVAGIGERQPGWPRPRCGRRISRYVTPMWRRRALRDATPLWRWARWRWLGACGSGRRSRRCNFRVLGRIFAHMVTGRGPGARPARSADPRRVRRRHVLRGSLRVGR